MSDSNSEKVPAKKVRKVRVKTPEEKIATVQSKLDQYLVEKTELQDDVRLASSVPFKHVHDLLQDELEDCEQDIQKCLEMIEILKNPDASKIDEE